MKGGMKCSMNISIVFLGGSRQLSGCDKIVLQLAEGATVQTAIELLKTKYPQLVPHFETVRWACNFEFVAPSHSLREGDEVALVPPVSGGAPRAVLTTETIAAQDVVARVSRSSVGATVVFIGTVRDHARGKRVQHLEYEAYVPMAQLQLEKIADDLSAVHSACEVAIAHRYGHIAIGEISVVIAAAAAHRDEAFVACREAIEKIKVDVPIFKRETTDDGAEFIAWGGG